MPVLTAPNHTRLFRASVKKWGELVRARVLRTMVGNRRNDRNRSSRVTRHGSVSVSDLSPDSGLTQFATATACSRRPLSFLKYEIV